MKVLNYNRQIAHGRIHFCVFIFKRQVLNFLFDIPEFVIHRTSVRLGYETDEFTVWLIAVVQIVIS